MATTTDTVRLDTSNKREKVKFIGSSFSVCLIMLDVQTDQHHGWSLAQIDNGAHGTIDTQGIELLPGSRFDHAVQFFKVETGMAPELWQE